MKKTIIIILFTGIIILASLLLLNIKDKPSSKVINNITTQQTTGTTSLQISQDSSIKRYAKKIGGSHNGEIEIKTGNVLVINNMVSGGEILINMNNISVKDIKNPETEKSLIQHLKSKDFFNTTKYPISKFIIKSIQEKNIVGDLTIKDTTHTIQVPSSIKKTNKGYNIYSKFTIDRTMRDIMYNSTNLASTIKDKAINNLIEFEININTKSH